MSYRQMVMKNIESNYLTNIPQESEKYGLCKTYVVRREVIHIKHIFTEIFVRRSIDIEKYLSKLDMSLFDYIGIMTNRIRNIHCIDRGYRNSIEKIIKGSRDNFFPLMELLSGLNNTVVLDFDGVVTDKRFHKLYQLCLERELVKICSANPTIKNEWFKKRNLNIPSEINSMKGKVRKIKRLIEIQKKKDYVFYIDNEKEYLEFAWIFGMQTFLWDGKKIKYFTMKTK